MKYYVILQCQIYRKPVFRAEPYLKIHHADWRNRFKSVILSEIHKQFWKHTNNTDSTNFTLALEKVTKKEYTHR